MSSVAMWRGCRRLWWAHSPPARLPRPPPVDAGGGPVGSCGRRAYAPPAERKRFYQNVSISQGEGECGHRDGMEGLLPGRGVITPHHISTCSPGCVRGRFNNSIFNCFYPQTTLCNTALDNPTQRNKTQLIRAAVKFLETDTVWYEMGTQLELGKRAG
ncbi:ATPF2 factor, partial [Spizella passerina]|nr:ATPF2 factor [Spizella passerina]